MVAYSRRIFWHRGWNPGPRSPDLSWKSATLPLADYGRVVRHLPTIGPLRGCECKRLITTVRNSRSTEALEVVSSQQLGHASPWLALDRECPDPLLPRHLSCNLFAVQGMSLSSGLIRSTDMIGHSFMTWEASVSLESEVAPLRRGDLNALSALLMRYQNRLYRYWKSNPGP